MHAIERLTHDFKMNQQQPQHSHIQDDHNPNLGPASYAFYPPEQDPSFGIQYPPQMSPYQVVQHPGPQTRVFSQPTLITH